MLIEPRDAEPGRFGGAAPVKLFLAVAGGCEPELTTELLQAPSDEPADVCRLTAGAVPGRSRPRADEQA